MATISSTKPGEIGGTSILAKRSPTYRLVLKVDPTSGQYKYEYEVDDAPKVSDVIQSSTPVVPVVPDPSDPGDSTPTPGPTLPEDPGTSFEQTKRMLGGGGDKGPMQNLDSGEYKMNNDGSVGYRRANQNNFITVNKTSPGAQKFMAGITKGIGKATDTIQDYVSTGGAIGSAIKDIFSGKKSATEEKARGFTQRDVSGEVKSKVEPSFNADEQQQKYTPSSAAVPSINEIQNTLADLKSRKASLSSGITKGEMYEGTISDINKEIQQTNEMLNREIANTDTTPGTPLTSGTQANIPRGPAELGASTRSDLNEAIREGNVDTAINVAKTNAGASGKSRDAAERDINNAHANAASNTKGAKYGGAKTSSEKNKIDQNNAAARSAASKIDGGTSRDIDRNNSVSNAARSNEVSDKNGNAVTSNGKAVNTKQKKSSGGGKKSPRVICTELYRQGLMPREDWKLDLWYTQTYLTRQHIVGYWYYAIPVVKVMRTSKLVTNIWKHIAINRTQDIKWRLNKGKFNLLGRVYSIILETTANILGQFVDTKDYSILYKGENKWQ